MGKLNLYFVNSQKLPSPKPFRGEDWGLGGDNEESLSNLLESVIEAVWAPLREDM